jgi:hypothetical protein
MKATTNPIRAGKTDKVSVSIDRSDLVILRRRARRLYHGNLSAVVAEGVRRVREEEGREALVAWLGEHGDASAEQRDAIRAEWTGKPRKRTARRRGT